MPARGDWDIVGLRPSGSDPTQLELVNTRDDDDTRVIPLDFPFCIMLMSAPRHETASCFATVDLTFNFEHEDGNLVAALRDNTRFTDILSAEYNNAPIPGQVLLIGHIASSQLPRAYRRDLTVRVGLRIETVGVAESLAFRSTPPPIKVRAASAEYAVMGSLNEHMVRPLVEEFKRMVQRVPAEVQHLPVEAPRPKWPTPEVGPDFVGVHISDPKMAIGPEQRKFRTLYVSSDGTVVQRLDGSAVLVPTGVPRNLIARMANYIINVCIAHGATAAQVHSREIALRDANLRELLQRGRALEKTNAELLRILETEHALAAEEYKFMQPDVDYPW